MEQEKRWIKSPFRPKVSVVIPFYNRADKTVQAIASVIGQTYKNVEIVLVNDGSTDDVSSVNNLAKRHKNIKLVTLAKNVGPAGARNAGIKKATGKYIAFLDSDDVFLSDKLEKQLSMMSRLNPDISYSSYTRREGDQEKVISDPKLTGIVVPLIIDNCTIATPTVIVRKALLTNNNMYFDETLRVGEDTCLWLEIAKRSEILLVDEPLTIVNVGEETHARDNAKLLVGLKNIITYLLNDDYYRRYDGEISLLFDYFSAINKQMNQQEPNRLLHEWPAVSVEPSPSKMPLAGSRTKALARRSLTAVRKLYHMGLSASKGGAASK